jgi:YegS/Rv2252/BmrU family lipid kinase
MKVHAAFPGLLGESPAAVFVNPAAGGGHTLLYLSPIQKLFESFHIPAQFIATHSRAELEAAAQTAILQGRRTLFAMGGDGTFQALANAAFGADVVLGVLPSGGGNDFAAALGLPGGLLKAAEAILVGKPRFVDLVRVRTAEGRTRLYVGGGGIGLDAEAARYASGACQRFPGRMRYIASALRALAGFVPLEIHVEFPGSNLLPEDRKVLLAAALNTPTYGAGLRLAPEAAVDDGLLHVVLIEALGILGVLRLLPRLMGSGELRTSRVQRWQVRKVRFTTSKPCLFHGDGEIIGSTPVEIELVQRAIQVLAPVPLQSL